jgi:hypothetical protein
MVIATRNIPIGTLPPKRGETTKLAAVAINTAAIAMAAACTDFGIRSVILSIEPVSLGIEELTSVGSTSGQNCVTTGERLDRARLNTNSQ